MIITTKNFLTRPWDDVVAQYDLDGTGVELTTELIKQFSNDWLVWALGKGSADTICSVL